MSKIITQKRYVIGEDSEITITPEYLEKENPLLYADDTKIELYRTDLYEESHLPVHIKLRRNHERDSTKWIDIVFKHKSQLAGLIKAFEEYLTIASDEDFLPEKPVISLPNPDHDIINYKCPVCGYDFLCYRSSCECPRCHKMIDWGKNKPKIKKILSWEDEDEDDE